MKFEIKREIDFEIEDFASRALKVVDEDFYCNFSDYEVLNNKQRNELLKAVFSRALEILKEED